MIIRKGNLRHKNLNNIFIGLNFFLFIFLAYYFTRVNIGEINYGKSLFILLGSFVTLFGFILRLASIIIMGRGFVPNVMLQSHQQLIQIGIYKVIRHPSYLGVILIYSGLSLMLTNWLLLLSSLGFSLVVYEWRMRLEEKELMKKYGRAFLEYQGKTSKLIPFIY